MTSPTRSHCTWLATIVGLFLVANAVAQGGLGEASLDAGRNAALALAGILIAVGGELRRRVNASMWAPREKAFTRRTQTAERRLRSGRAR